MLESEKYGKWTVLGAAPSGGRGRMVRCRCDCGTVAILAHREVKHARGNSGCRSCLGHAAPPVGAAFGKWTIASGLLPRKGRMVACRCACGKVRAIRVSDLVRKRTMACQKCTNGAQRLVPIPPAGSRVGSWTVTGRVTRAGHQAYVRCRCACGVERSVSAYTLAIGSSRGCRTCAGAGRATHGATRHRAQTPEYAAWVNMRKRCYDPSTIGFKNYGGRGIRVCPRWTEARGFENFLSDVGPRPTPGHSLDRKRNDGNYDPDNCRWATKIEQSNNTRTNRLVMFRGKEVSLMEAVRMVGTAQYGAVRARIGRGWPVPVAIETPPLRPGGRLAPTRSGNRKVRR